MTISQELIAQLSEQPVEKTNPNNRTKYLHLRKEIMLQDNVVGLTHRQTFNLSLDEKTFNGADRLAVKFGDGAYSSHHLNFDAATVAYKQNDAGDLDVVVVFKSANDEYRKDVGRKLAETVLNLYLNVDSKVNVWHHTDHYGYHAMVLTMPISDFTGDDIQNIIPTHILGKLAVSDLKNSLVVNSIKFQVYGMIGYLVTHTASGYSAWVPEYNFR